MTTITKVITKTFETETEEFLVQGQILKVEFYAETPKGWNDFESEMWIEKINGTDPDFFQDWVQFNICEQIRVHKLKGKEYSLEYKSEQRGDESRGN